MGASARDTAGVSQENLALVRDAYAAFDRGDYPAMLAILSPDAITHRAPPQPDAGTWHGPEGILQALADWTTDFENFEMSADRFVDAGESRVIVRVRQRATGKASGAPIEADFWLVHTLRDRRVTRTDIFVREQQALEAAGLSN